ncbi:MAG: hypothetical protein AAF821_24780 [Cyanobacteria bacterium P01_D01_bin.156]
MDGLWLCHGPNFAVADWFDFMVASAGLLRAIAVAMILAVTCFQAPSLAVEQLGAAIVNQPATLIGPRSDAPIPLSLRPAPNQPNVGYGINGDSVTVMEQLASFLPEADASTAWNHIRLNSEPYTEGWVQGKFLSMEDQDLLE